MRHRLRLSAGLLAAALAFAPAFLRAQSCGVERWSVKTGTDADVGLVDLNAPQANDITTMRSWPAPSPIPANNRVSPYETTVWVLNATLVQYKLENDSDYHLVLQDASGLTMIAEIPSPSCVGSSSPFLSGITNARSQFDAVYTATTSFQTANVPVKITGIGMFDFLHGQTGVAPNGIELHPVIDIQFNPSAGNTVAASITTPASNVTLASGANQAFTGTATDSSSAATLSYSWNFGDGATAAGATASHVFTNTGTSAVAYTVTFTATDNTGASNSATRTVTVNPPAGNTVTASITTPSGNVTLASGTAQSFAGSGTDSSSTATLSYAWTFGDGGTATGASASHTYTNTGTSAVSYTATLKVTDNTGVSSTATRTITVNPASAPPPNTVTASITTPSGNVTLASGASQAFAGSATDSSSTATLSYAWNFGDGTTATGASTSHVFTNTGSSAITRTVTFTATDNTGVSNSATRTITVNPAPSGGGTQLLVNPGFENGNVSWSNYSTVGGGGAVVNSDMVSEPSHSGSWNAWLNGYGRADTDTLYQNVAIPSSASTATLSFWLHIDTAETTTTTAYDKLTVQVQTSGGSVLATLGTFSNLNAGSGYTLYTYDLSAYRGQTVKIYLKGVEDASYQTSFVVDDFALNIQ